MSPAGDLADRKTILLAEDDYELGAHSCVTTPASFGRFSAAMRRRPDWHWLGFNESP